MNRRITEMPIFRVQYMTTEAIPHVYCRVFSAPDRDKTFASCGQLTMRKDEFEVFRKLFNAEFVEHP